MAALDFPASPVDGQEYNGYVWVASLGAWRLLPIEPSIDLDMLADVAITTPVAGQKLIYNGTNWINLTGYVLVNTLYYTSNSTFTKATYPWLRAIRVRVQGAGGGGGGVPFAGSGSFAASAGAGAGGYAESFITNISGLASSITVTVGAGGNGGAAGNNNGAAGGNSSFGSTVIGNGGAGGGGQNAFTFWITSAGGIGGSGTGDLVIPGGDGQSGNPVNANGGYGGLGGQSVLGEVALANSAWQSAGAGTNGKLYGGGGSGAAVGQNFGGAAGGNGAAGIVIVELYA